MDKHQFSRMTALFVVLFFTLVLYGQNVISLSGTVLDSKNKEPLIGVTVVEEGTTNGTATDLDGKFVLKVASNAILRVSYMGYTSKKITVTNNQYLTILLEEESRLLDEVVVVGYGVQKKSDITGAISSVSGDAINSVPVASALQALQGKASRCEHYSKYRSTWR